MTRRTPVATILSVLATAAAIFLAAPLRADDGHSPKVCSNASLKGSYGFYRTGTNAHGPLAAVGLITFDGKGNSTATQSISRNGDIEFDVTFPGTYVIGADCTGKGFTPDGDEFVRLVVMEAGKSLLMFSEAPGNAVYGVGTRTREE